MIQMISKYSGRSAGHQKKLSFLLQKLSGQHCWHTDKVFLTLSVALAKILKGREEDKN